MNADVKNTLIYGTLFFLAGATLVGFLNKKNVQQVEVVQEDSSQGVGVYDGMPLYDINFTMIGNAFNPLADVYSPLFGFVPAAVMPF